MVVNHTVRHGSGHATLATWTCFLLSRIVSLRMRETLDIVAEWLPQASAVFLTATLLLSILASVAGRLGGIPDEVEVDFIESGRGRGAGDLDGVVPNQGGRRGRPRWAGRWSGTP